MSQNYPVIVGAGQLTNRVKSLDDALEPVELMVRAARTAAEDTGVPGLLSKADSVQVVNLFSWPYPDAPGLLAEKIGAAPSQKMYTAVGGETPQRLVNQAGQDIVEGRVRIALLAGAEAMASRSLARKQNAQLPWPVRGNPEHVSGDKRNGFTDVEARHGAVMPTRMYPLFENAIRAQAGRTVGEHQQWLGELCARFTKVAAANPHAWFPEERSADEITTVGPRNRWVCFPYPKLMNAIIEVDQGAAVIVTGSETARELGIPEEKWVYLHGCGEAVDKWFVSDRVNYHTSPAIKAATSRALGMAGIAAREIDFFDLYSCFPSAVQLAMDALGLRSDEARPLTVTGGLPYAGGPGNDYVMHSIATTVERLRANPGQMALVTGLGWFATKHSAGVYSTQRPSGEWSRTDPAIDQAAVDAGESPQFLAYAEGPGRIETYTVAFNREGEPELGLVVGRLDSGERFFANTPADADLLWSMTREEYVGRRGSVAHDAATQKNIFRPL
jgi:acetyl-CoA C-acetyltransferase